MKSTFCNDVNELLQLAVTSNASDLHLTVGLPPMLRIDGELHRSDGAIVTREQTESFLRQLLPNQDEHRFRKSGEIDFAYNLQRVARFRINAYLQKGMISLAIRVIPIRLPTYEELGLPTQLLELTTKSHGLVLVTGPTGSGKSTTLAAMIDHMNRTQKKHILTLEDPIEYLHQHQSSIIDQREVGSDTASFLHGLRAAVRQDPDVILLGEMRDLETIQTAITAAETGHLVLASLHTSDAPQTIDRIVDVFPSEQQAQIRFQLAYVLLGISSQHLLPLKNGKGRVCVAEILLNNAAVANLIRQGKVHQIKSVMQTSRLHGMQTLEMALKECVQQGILAENVMSQYIITLNRD